MARRALLIGVACCLALVGLAGCARDDADGKFPGAGAWRAEFEAAFDATDSQLARAVLEDGRIAQAEVAEVNAALTKCLEGIGLTGVRMPDSGGLSWEYPAGSASHEWPTLEAGAMQCQKETGWDVVVQLRDAVRRSPAKSDVTQETAECLVRNGFRPQGYSAQAYREENSSPTGFEDLGPDDARWPTFLSCVNDPLNAP